MQNSTVIQFDSNIWNADGKIKHGPVQGKERAKLSNFDRFSKKTKMLEQSLVSSEVPEKNVVAETTNAPEMPVVPPVNEEKNNISDQAIMAKLSLVTPIPSNDQSVIAIENLLEQNKNINGTNRLRVSEVVLNNTRLTGEVVDRNVISVPETKIPDITPLSSSLDSTTETVAPSAISSETDVTEKTSPSFDFGQTVNLSQLDEETKPEETKEIKTPGTSLLSDREKDEKLNDILNHVHSTPLDVTEEKKDLANDIDLLKVAKVKETIAEKDVSIEELRNGNKELEHTISMKKIELQKEYEKDNDHLAELAVIETAEKKKKEELLAQLSKLDALLNRKKARLTEQAEINSLKEDEDLDTSSKGLAA